MKLGEASLWPPEVPTAVLAESLTGDHRRDVLTNRLLRGCLVRPVEESHGREAARLRTTTGRAGRVSAVDALVVALAAEGPDSVVLTTDPKDLRTLARHVHVPIGISPV